MTSGSSQYIRISVIIPTLNEEEYLESTLSNVVKTATDPENIEVVVVDAGSTDNTLQSIQHEVTICRDPEFRGKKYASLNRGIDMSKGEVLIFLDADTLLPHGFDKLVLEKLSHDHIAGGAFDMVFSRADLKLKLLETANRLRFRLDYQFFGDQAVFCRKSDALTVGGIPPEPLMETIYFLKKIKKRGRLTLIKAPVRTSPRRFEQHGFWRVLSYDLGVWIRYIFRQRTDQLADGYWSMGSTPMRSKRGRGP